MDECPSSKGKGRGSINNARRLLFQFRRVPTVGKMRSSEVPFSVSVGFDRGRTVYDFVASGQISEHEALRAAVLVSGLPERGESGPAASVALRVGATLGDIAAPPLTKTELMMIVIGGFGSGAGYRVPVGLSTLGREPSCQISLSDATVSARHAELNIQIDDSGKLTAQLRDLASVNGTTINGCDVGPDWIGVETNDIIGIGSALLQLVAEIHDRPVGCGEREGRFEFNRPPAKRVVRNGETLSVPRPPDPVLGHPPFRVGSVLIPLLAAFVLVAVTGQVLFLAFAITSPLMLLSNLISDHRSSRTKSRKDGARFERELLLFERNLHRAADRERLERADSVPNLGEMVRRASTPSRRLWERRPDDPLFVHIRLGVGEELWLPPVDRHVQPDPVVQAVLDRHRTLHDTPISLPVSAGQVVGIVGARELGQDLAASVAIQLAIHQGPSDLRLVVATDPDQLFRWDWLKWLPHLGLKDLVAGAYCGPEELQQLAKHFASVRHRSSWPTTRAPDRNGVVEKSDPLTVALVDVEPGGLTKLGPISSWFARIDRPIAIVVLAPTRDQLPAGCTAIVELRDRGRVAFLERRESDALAELVLDLIDRGALGLACRSLARYIDPDEQSLLSTLPNGVRLSGLIELPVVDQFGCPSSTPATSLLIERWKTASPGEAPRAAIGRSETGVVSIDLATDGPHGLIGGTTGAGKSELLRTLVSSFALSSSPEELTFVLIDYKGGSAFDACVGLPHVVGLLTDLDEQLGERALVSLEAELRRREEILRLAGSTDRDSYARVSSAKNEPLPRMLIVVDEFATLKAELPAFVDALVDVAQRGRSLGVHLFLATQRPAGVVSDLIRANTDLKIAMRMQEPADAIDVIGTPEAAELARDRRGTGFVRFGTTTPVLTQVAYCGGPAKESACTTVLPFVLKTQREPPIQSIRTSGESDEEGNPKSELEILVEAARLAASALNISAPRKPWSEPIPSGLRFVDLPIDVEKGRFVAGLTDDPRHQKQYPLYWDGNSNLALIGTDSADMRETIRTLIVSACRIRTPEELHIYAVAVSPTLREMITLPNVGDVVAPTDTDRLRRLLATLGAEVMKRRSEPMSQSGPIPRIVWFIESIQSLRAEIDDSSTGTSLWDKLVRILTDGPSVGVCAAFSLERASMLSGQLGAVATQRWVFRLADRLDGAFLGIQAVKMASLGRRACLVAETGLLAQIAVADDLLEPNTSGETKRGWAAPIRTLPGFISTGDLFDLVEKPSLTACGPATFRIPIGISDTDLAPAYLEAHGGEHLLVVGAARSGRTITLGTIVESIARFDPHRSIVILAPQRSMLPSLATSLLTDRPASRIAIVENVSDLEASFDCRQGPVAVVVDDAELFEDPSGFLGRLLLHDDGSVFIAAAVRTELLRGNYSHWARQLRRSRLAILLRPSDHDAELTGLAIPRRGVPSEPGRGLLAVSGVFEVVQFACGAQRLKPTIAEMIDDTVQHSLL